MPVLAIGGATSGGPLAEQMLLEVAENVTEWSCWERPPGFRQRLPELLSAALLEFLAGADRQVVESRQNTTIARR